MFRDREGEHQLSFGGQTAIQPVNPDAGRILPVYTPISQVPPTSSKDDRYDILGVVVHMEGIQKKKSLHGYDFNVRDIVVVDQSVQRLGEARIISAYGDLATNECEKLAGWCESFMVVSFASLQAATHGGFSLASSMSTTIDPQPTGPEVDALKAWVVENKDKLADHAAHELQVREATSSDIITTVAEINSKTPMTTTAYERRWLKVTIPAPQKDSVVAYIGCSGCGNRCDSPEAAKFECEYCFATCVAQLRVNFSFFASDATGSIRLTAYGKHCEQLLNLTAAEILEKKLGEWPEFAAIESALQSKPVKIQLGPTGAIKRVGYLKWVIKAIIQE